MIKFKTFLLEKNKNKYRIFVDMDGVLVNFDKQIQKEIGTNNIDKVFDFLGTPKGASREFWFEMNPLPDGRKLWKALQTGNFEPEILSACPRECKDAKEVIKAKTDWLKEHLGFTDKSKIHIVRRKDKQKFAEKNSILIDDFTKNIKEFEAAGGTGILYKNFNDTTKQLMGLIEEKQNEF